ncbi:MAG: sensor histidine kinase [Acetatifactor sp.]|nr:sensor histidine kinase [Acetatifactor sp.]
MIQDNYRILTEMLSSFHQELSDINARIHENDLFIKEEVACVKALENTDDFQVFYPRKDNTPLQKDEIEKSNSRKADYEELNGKLNKTKAILEERIKKLEKILKYESYNITAINFQEDDRQRIARDLHDASLQNLVHLVHKLELCHLYIDQDPLKAKLELSLVSKGLKEVLNEIRNTIFDLRPMSFDDLGLKAGLERLLERINENKKYEIISDIDDVSCENNFILVYIYRTVQEGLNNILKHAEAEKIIFRCKMIDDLCVIDMEDDGKGFCEELEEERGDKHFGLSSMRERIELLNGIIEISSSEGNGTKIHIEIPLAE